MSENNPKRTWTEEIEVAGGKLVERVKELIREGNVRRLVLRKANGDTLIEVPLTAGVAVGGLIAMMAPIFAALGALAGLIAEFKIEVIRDRGDAGTKSGSGDSGDA
jgi:hypothetical protein